MKKKQTTTIDYYIIIIIYWFKLVNNLKNINWYEVLVCIKFKKYKLIIFISLYININFFIIIKLVYLKNNNKMLNILIKLEIKTYKLQESIYRIEIKIYVFKKKKVKTAHSTEKNDSFNISITCSKFLSN